MRDINNNKKLKIIVIIALAALAVCAVLAGVMVVRHRQGPAEGIVVRPAGKWVCEGPVFYRQNEKEWKDDRMGAAVDTVGGSGCLVTCLAASMEMQMRTFDEGYRMTPGKLNEELSGNQVYDARGNILWNPLREYLKDWEIETPSKVQGDLIEEMLENGEYPIVKVRMPVSGANHWVLLLEARDGEYYCMDPLNGEDEMVSLEKFGNTVYSVRSISLH